jgi:predicted enzyme related to lactoylglutathione lyase
MSDTHPTLGNGKICYIEIPAANIQVSSTFYQKTFGWRIRQRGDGATAFDDAVGQVSGTWVLGRKPMTEVSLLFYIMVDNMHVTIDAVIANGGKIVEPVGKFGKEIVAWFSDPAGNIVGLYQQPK